MIRKPRFAFHDGNLETSLEGRFHHKRLIDNTSLQANSRMLQRFGPSLYRYSQDSHAYNSLVWNSDGSRLVGSTPRKITVWDYRGLHRYFKIEYIQYQDIHYAKPVPKSDKEIIFTDSSKVLLYDVNNHRVMERVKCHDGFVSNLAFPAGDPCVLLSTGSDNTVRQHDLREPPCLGNCTKVLLNLKDVRRKSLVISPCGSFFILSSDLSPISSNFIIVGGNDRFGRLFDRRSVQTGQGRQKHLTPVNYYCPRHLSLHHNTKKPFGKDHSVVKVAFSPHESEVLLSYSGEHCYVMNVNHDGANEDLYSPDDVIKMMKIPKGRDCLVPTSKKQRVEPPRLEPSRDIKIRNQVSDLLKDCTTHEAIDILDAFLSLPGCPIEEAVVYDWLCCRAKCLLERKWKNDVHFAIRDCYRARKIKSDDEYRSFIYLSKALSQLGRRKEASESAKVAATAKSSHLDPEVVCLMETFAQEIGTEESVESRCWIDEEIQNSLDKPRKGNDWRKDFKAIDTKQRFVGHRNDYDDHFDVGFLGQQGEYVISGSADGMVYIWEKISGRLVRTLKKAESKLKKAESKLGKCLQSHPFDSAVAIGCDGEPGKHVVEIWAPNIDGVESNANADFEAMDANQKKIMS